MGMQNEQRIDVLDGLRAWAIILVVASHTINPFADGFSSDFLNILGFEFSYLFANGWVGVELFFVLSGFLITTQLLNRYVDPDAKSLDFESYVLLRFFRIAPAYYLAIFITLSGIIPYDEHPDNYENLILRIFVHMFFLQNFFLADFVSTFWSIAVEWEFYLMAPFIVLAALYVRSKYALPLIVMGLWGIAFYCRYNYFQSHDNPIEINKFFWDIRHPTHFQIDGLLAGMLCAWVWQHHKLKEFLSRPIISNAFVFCGLGFVFYVCFERPWMFESHISPLIVYMKTIVPIGFSFVMLGLLAGSKFGFFFKGRFYKLIAVLSYSIYLLHLQIFVSFFAFLKYYTNITSYYPPLAFAIFFILGMFICLAVALPIYLYFEKPIIDWSKRVFLKKNESCES